jgi:hypothetical protein
MGTRMTRMEISTDVVKSKGECIWIEVEGRLGEEIGHVVGERWMYMVAG